MYGLGFSVVGFGVKGLRFKVLKDLNGVAKLQPTSHVSRESSSRLQMQQ